MKSPMYITTCLPFIYSSIGIWLDFCQLRCFFHGSVRFLAVSLSTFENAGLCISHILWHCMWRSCQGSQCSKCFIAVKHGDKKQIWTCLERSSIITIMLEWWRQINQTPVHTMWYEYRKYRCLKILLSQIEIVIFFDKNPKKHSSWIYTII